VLQNEHDTFVIEIKPCKALLFASRLILFKREAVNEIAHSDWHHDFWM